MKITRITPSQFDNGYKLIYWSCTRMVKVSSELYAKEELAEAKAKEELKKINHK